MKNNSSFWVVKTVIWLLVILSILLLVVLPLVTSLLLGYGDVPSSYLKYIRIVETLQSFFMRGFIGLWFFFLGSCFASFLNVVAWRVPRGRSILGSSRCPHCDTRLSFKDNVPVLGWLKNAGACSFCNAPIAPRYFLVEVLLGAIFLLLTMVCLYSGGINIPFRTANHPIGFERNLFGPQTGLIPILAHHLTLLSFLFTFALVRFERMAIPISIFYTGAIFGVAFALLFPVVQIVGWLNPTTTPANYDTFSMGQPLTMVFGAVSGTFCGALMTLDPQARRAAILSMSLTGIFLGWQAVLSVCAITLILHLVTTLVPLTPSEDSWTWPSKVLAGVLVHLVFWNPLTLLDGYWISHSSSWVQIILFLLALGLGLFLGNVLSYAKPNPEQLAE